MNNIRSRFSSLREYLTPVTHTSTFKTTGEITPEEFVAAGDYLSYKFPTWQWCPVADDSLEKTFLPKDRQFLVTRKVPSYQRALSYLNGGAEEDDEEDVADEDGWTTTHTHMLKKGDNEKEVAVAKNDHSHELINDQEIQDIDDDDFDIEPVVEDGKNPSGGVVSSSQESRRNYDLYITYSTSYRVPKMYLVGFDADGIPLTPDQMFEDISADYRDKTATIEKAPFLQNTTSVSIHPCRHATVMKVLMSRAQIAAQSRKAEAAEAATKDITQGINKLGLKDSEETGGDDEWEDVQGVGNNKEEDEEDGVIRVDQYLVIFLKFIASVTPGIYHDYTMDAL
ncbi:Atg3 protein [Saccharomycopsis crataegensis]|uniref:Autophagy-related protein 3 n=1 Tax=Saccharomycopsis crataegensis TaxID=43959 RepID=A0AAV5QH78_9ASCO|nr:Atg3 protein [Saccharomycopsis crataegensis]